VLVPSLGPPPVKVPDLVNKTVPEARALLAQVGLELGTPTERYDEKFPTGRIVSQSEQAKTRIPQGSTIEVVVSKGPAPVPVPRVIGQSQENAQSLLAAWVVNVEEDYSDTVPRGDVIAQDPDPKTKLQPGQTVTITVSLGPRTFPMPDVLRMSKDAAIAKLQALGLRVAVATVTGSSGTTVVGQIPVAGVMVRAGATVTIYVGL
jgi:serine/threonine-protein kinase